MSKPRAKTAIEVRAEFLQRLSDIVDHWLKAEGSERWRMEGAIHSILVTLEGNSGTMPGFIVAPKPHPDDREYHINRGENYFPESSLINRAKDNDIVAGVPSLLNRDWNKYTKAKPPTRKIPPLPKG